MSTSLTLRLNLVFSIIFPILLVAILMVPGNPIENLPGQDNGVFLYAGQQIVAGNIPYLDFWDHKGPLIFYINAFGLMLASGSRWGVWLLEFIFLIFTALGLYRIAREKWTPIIGALALVIWFLLMEKVGSYYHFGDSNYTESYGLIFSVSAILFWLWSQNNRKALLWCFLVGLTAGLNFALRPTERLIIW